MPPPPPPSASYHLVIDTDSSYDSKDSNGGEEEKKTSDRLGTSAVGGGGSSSGGGGGGTALFANLRLAIDEATKRIRTTSIDDGDDDDQDQRADGRADDDQRAGDGQAGAVAAGQQQEGHQQEGRQQEGQSQSMEIDGEAQQQHHQTPKNKKRRKKRKKKKKKKNSSGNSGNGDGASGSGGSGSGGNGDDNSKFNGGADAVEEERQENSDFSVEELPWTDSIPPPPNLDDDDDKKPPTAASNSELKLNGNKGDGRPKPKTKLTKSLSFGQVQVREYARAMSTDAVPADGGWPLGLSDHLIREYHVGQVDEFEHRRQVELHARYVEVMERRRARLERRWREEQKEDGGGGGSGGKGHHHGRGRKHHHGGRKRSGSGDYGGGGGVNKGGKSGRARSGSDPGPSPTSPTSTASTSSATHGGGSGSNPSSPDGKRQIFNSEIHIKAPRGTLETRPFDYKRREKVLAHKSLLAEEEIEEGGSGSSMSSIIEALDDGKNPLFATKGEDERMFLLIRDSDAGPDDHDNDIHHHVGDEASNEDGGGAPPSPGRKRSHSSADQYKYHPPSPTSSQKHSSSGRRLRSLSNADHYKYNDVYSHADVLHVRHELEQLRAQRTGEGVAGCTCRKLHVVLPGHTGKSKKRKHHRMTERRVKEELRKRGLMHGDNLKLGRDELEQLLHDTVENEPCCWGDDCPCVHNGIVCQSDTCSCWHPGHDNTDDKHKKSKETLYDVASLGVGAIKQRCGNRYGCYTVNFVEINKRRRKLIMSPLNGGAKDDVQLCLPVGEESN